MIADPVLCSKYWLVRKVVAVVGYYGGFRNIELKALKFGFLLDEAGNATAEKVLEKSSDGSYWFQFYQSKQRKSKVLTQICVPKCSNEMIDCLGSVERVPLGICPASVIDQYLNVLSTDLNCSVEDLDGEFFKSTHGKEGKKFGRVPLGKNKLALVGIEFAQELMLPNPGAYTGHCWRRSCSTNSSDAGVNVTSLMAHMGWSDPKTAIRYVQKSKQSAHQMAMYLCNAQRSNLREEDLFRIPNVMPSKAATHLPKRVKLPASFVGTSSGCASANSSSSTLSRVCATASSSTSSAISSTSSLLRSCASEDLSTSVAVSGPPLHFCESNEDSKFVTESDSVKSSEDSSSVAINEGLNPLPAVGVENQSLEKHVASCLSGLVGSIVNSGTINFNVSFVTK